VIVELEGRGERRNAVLRLALAVTIVAAAHGAALAWLAFHDLGVQMPDTVQGAPIDLELLAVAPDLPQATPKLDQTPEATPTTEPPPSPTPAPDPSAPTPEPKPEVQPTPGPPPPTPEPTPVVQPAPDPKPSPEPLPLTPDPTPEVPTPQPTATPTPTAPPPPKPESKPQPRPVPSPKPDPKKIEKERAQAEARRKERAEPANPAPTETSHATTTDNPQGAAAQRASSGAHVTTWRGEVLARISEFRPAATGATGTALISFTVDDSGRVTSVSLARSSGDAGLDAASVAMVRRASPVPPPPSELGGHVNLTVPVRYQ
jgi:periplasmic protein TonB